LGKDGDRFAREAPDNFYYRDPSPDLELSEGPSARRPTRQKKERKSFPSKQLHGGKPPQKPTRGCKPPESRARMKRNAARLQST